ncbi:MAG TPA: DUF5615 family PIN-like protein [Bryobacteraceae bacterium]
MRIRFLADADFNQKIAAGLLLREPRIDFVLPQRFIPDGTKDPAVLRLGNQLGRIIVTHDVRTMPVHFRSYTQQQKCAGLILVPQRMPIRLAIEDLLLIWQASEAEEWINRMRWLPL